ncbi:MAG: CocE/NonD family hydrolase [bacterium]
MLLLLGSCGGRGQQPELNNAPQQPDPGQQLSTQLPAPDLSESLMATPLRRGTSDISGMADGWTPNVMGTGNFSQDGSALVISTGSKEYVGALYRLVFADGAIYQKQVPYIYPYEIHVKTDNGGPVYVMLPDYPSKRWMVHDGQSQSGSTIIVPAGLTGNHGNRTGSIVFGLVAYDGSNVRIEGIDLILPDIPSGSDPVDYHQFIEAADGTMLATDIYLPYAESNPFIPDPPYPTVLIRTPYDKSLIETSLVKLLTDINVTVMVQYFRGRLSDSGGWPDSGGTESIFRDHNGPEHYDAIDTVDWLEARHWYGGKLLISGPSALGIWNYQAASGLGDRLAGFYPIVASGNVAEWAMVDNGVLKQSNVSHFLIANNYPPALFDEVLANFSDQSYIDSFETAGSAGDVQAPGYHETGWWDVEVDSTIDSWKALNDNGGVGAAGKQWLVIGPWEHNFPRANVVGDLSFPSNDRHDPSVLPSMLPTETWDGVEWGAALLTIPLKQPPASNHVLAYFVGEELDSTEPANTWYEFPDWPPPYTPLSLHMTSSGSLDATEEASPGLLGFSLDPGNPVTTIGGNLLPTIWDSVPLPAGPYNQAALLPDSRILEFTGTALGSPLSIAGPVMVQLFVSTDAVDSDVCVKLIDRYPDGTLMLVSDSVMRLSHASPGDHSGGETVELNFNLGSRAYVFGAGHQVVLHVQGSNFPKYNPNPGNGDKYYDLLNPGTAVVQNNSLKFGPGQSSRIILPLFDPSV